MDKITCSDCNTILPNQIDDCPSCGSQKKTIHMTIEDTLELKEEISFRMTHYEMVWSSLPKSLYLLIENLEVNPFAKAQKGFIIQGIIAMAALIEGVITDSIQAKLNEMEKQSNSDELFNDPRKWKYAGWTQKKGIVQRLLNVEIELIASSPTVCVLFDLRNLYGHGRPYEISYTWTSTFDNTERHELEILNAEYERIFRQLSMLQNSSEIHDRIPNSSREIFLTSEVAKLLYNHMIEFLEAFTRKPEISALYNVSAAWQWALYCSDKDFRN